MIKFMVDINVCIKLYRVVFVVSFLSESGMWEFGCMRMGFVCFCVFDCVCVDFYQKVILKL